MMIYWLFMSMSMTLRNVVELSEARAKKLRKEKGRVSKWIRINQCSNESETHAFHCEVTMTILDFRSNQFAKIEIWHLWIESRWIRVRYQFRSAMDHSLFIPFHVYVICYSVKSSEMRYCDAIAQVVGYRDPMQWTVPGTSLKNRMSLYEFRWHDCEIVCNESDVTSDVQKNDQMTQSSSLPFWSARRSLFLQDSVKWLSSKKLIVTFVRFVPIVQLELPWLGATLKKSFFNPLSENGDCWLSCKWTSSSNATDLCVLALD
jgi:hypothetical protein